MKLDEYSKKNIHFIDLQIPKILEILLKSYNKTFSIIDLGCGDGRILYALYNKGLLKNAYRIVGVDISKIRISRLKEFCPFAEGIVADVCDLKQIPDNSFDIVISSQVIEHVQDDTKMLKEVYRILKPNGYFYVSTIIKKWYGFWIYYNKGFKLDPTHVREYKSEEEFLSLLRDNGFIILYWNTMGIRRSIIDSILRGLIKLGLIKISPDFYLKHRVLSAMRNILRFKIIGYKFIEALTKVKK